jgi:hypothetical protein
VDGVAGVARPEAAAFIIVVPVDVAVAADMIGFVLFVGHHVLLAGDDHHRLAAPDLEQNCARDRGGRATALGEETKMKPTLVIISPLTG